MTIKYKILLWATDWLKRNNPELLTAMTLYRTLKSDWYSNALGGNPYFIFSILIGRRTAMPLIIDCTQDGLPHDDAVTLDAWWNEEAKPLVQPIADKINLLTGDNER